ncbi:MAG: ATP-binding cassette domain-containing protein [Armatimonadetes bacterium]|nr:ATP-binding cassette domain-containing protein [Armatimonadota bacterium]
MRFGSATVLKDIDLAVESGEMVAIMGSSGGGKTTLLRCISGLHASTSGSVTVDGINVIEEPELARTRMGMVFQSSALFDFMTVFENVMFGVRRHSKEPLKDQRQRVEIALERVGLKDEHHKMPAELSGGMRKRVGMARAIVLEPKVLLYDEPTTGLDPITTYTIDELMARMRGELGITGLVVSHDVTSVMRVADRVAFLHQGELAYSGDKEGFLKSEHPAIKELLTKSSALEFAR